MKRSLALALSAALLCGGVAGCGGDPGSSSAPAESEAPTAAQKTAAETVKTEPVTTEATTEDWVTKTALTGVNHNLSDDNCDPMDFKPGDTVSGEVDGFYSCIGTLSDVTTFGNSESGMSIYRMRFFPMDIGNISLVFGADNANSIIVEETVKKWDLYREKRVEGLTDEELEQYKPKPFTISGRVEPLPEDVESWLKEWYLNTFSDATEQNYTEYCQNTVYIVDSFYDS